LLRSNSRYNGDEGARYASTYNAGMMLDEQLDQEMHSALINSFSPRLPLIWHVDAMRNLPMSDDDKYHNTFGNKVG
jgi:hypothetical protein